MAIRIFIDGDVKIGLNQASLCSKAGATANLGIGLARQGSQPLECFLEESGPARSPLVKDRKRILKSPVKR